MKKFFLKFIAAAFCLIHFTPAIFSQVPPPKEENRHESDLLILGKFDGPIKSNNCDSCAGNFGGTAIYRLKSKTKDIAKAKMEEKKDWKKFFDAAGVTGGIAIYDLRQNKLMVYDRARVNKGFPPASTSKIIHSLIFLETGAVRDENETFKWDGTTQRIAAWNRDHNLRTAFQVSAVWFYTEASKRVGREEMQRFYDTANYGNRNTNGFGNDYWNKGELRVTPREQIEFLVRLHENRLPFSPRSISIVKNVMVAEKTGNYILRAKTGWSDAFTPQVGWWVGYIERGRDTYFFATEIDIKKDEDASRRQIITKNILRLLKIIE